MLSSGFGFSESGSAGFNKVSKITTKGPAMAPARSCAFGKTKRKSKFPQTASRIPFPNHPQKFLPFHLAMKPVARGGMGNREKAINDKFRKAKFEHIGLLFICCLTLFFMLLLYLPKS